MSEQMPVENRMAEILRRMLIKALEGAIDEVHENCVEGCDGYVWALYTALGGSLNALKTTKAEVFIGYMERLDRAEAALKKIMRAIYRNRPTPYESVETPVQTLSKIEKAIDNWRAGESDD